MIAPSNIAAGAHIPGAGGLPLKQQGFTRSDARMLMRILKHGNAHGLPVTKEQAQSWVDGVQALKASTNERNRATGLQLELLGLKLNFERAKLMAEYAMPKEAPKVNVAVFVKVIEGVNDDLT